MIHGLALALLAAAPSAVPAPSWPPADGNYAPYEDVSCRDDAPPVHYPRSLSRRGIGGTVMYRVSVDSQGRYLGAVIEQSSGSAELDAAGEKVLAHWCFRVGRQDGHPIGGDILVPIKFTP
jgi:TonB family protein